MIELKKISVNSMYFLFILCFSLFYSFNLIGQSYFYDLDSLIYNEKISEAKNWLNSKQPSDTSNKQLISKYKIVLSWKDKVKSISSDTLKILLTPNLNQQQTFSLKKSGSLSCPEIGLHLK